MAKKPVTTTGDLVRAAKECVAASRLKRCLLCSWTDGLKALDALVVEMLAQKRRLSYPVMCGFLRNRLGRTVSRWTLATHLHEHDPRWADIEKL